MKASVYAVLLLGAIDIAFSLARFLIVQLGNVADFRAITLIGMNSFLSPHLPNTSKFDSP
jgi:hypothetical protein